MVATLPAIAEQHHRDPLKDLKTTKFREAPKKPEARLKLYIKLARTRLEKLEQVRADDKAQDRDPRTRDALQDFLDVYDELNTNVDTFADRGDDLRKA